MVGFRYTIQSIHCAEAGPSDDTGTVAVSAVEQTPLTQLKP